MKISKGTTTMAVAAFVLGAALGAPVAGADTTPASWLGQEAQLDNGNVIQAWTISGLKPSSDVIPYNVHGTLWEATATDQAIQGSVIPIVSNLNARARNGDTYRVLFGVATPQGVNPATLAQGQSTSGKIYFDVVGQNPDSVFYSDADTELALWLQPPPVAATGGTTSSPASSSAAASTPGQTATTGPAAVIPGASQGTPIPAGSQGTPLPAGSQGAPQVPSTPVPAGSQGTPAGDIAPTMPAPPTPAASAGTAAAETAPAATAAPAPAASVGTPATASAPAAESAPAISATPAPAAPQGAQGTSTAAPSTTVVPQGSSGTS